MTCDLGVLFVHGIGAQERGATLAAFGGPVHAWLEDRFRGLDSQWRDALADQSDLLGWRQHLEDWATDGFHGTPPPPPATDGSPDNTWARLREIGQAKGCDPLVGRAVLVDSRVDDPDDARAPAHAVLVITRLTLEGRIQSERWRLAESCWAETFPVPNFAEFARWGLRVIPWTIGSHFGAQVRRAFAGRLAAAACDSFWYRGAWYIRRSLRIAAATLALFLGLLTSPLLLAAFGLLLLLAFLPIPQLREWLLNVQLQIAATLGDCYVLVGRPVEAAAIVGQVRRDLEWLAADCLGVAVVAHSQGGAVVHRVLQLSTPPVRLRLLFTFGSGLKKLEQLRYLLTSGHSFRRASVMTIVALPIFAAGLAWFALLSFVSLEHSSALWAQSPIVLAWTVVSGLLVFAGVRDHITAIGLPDLHRWLERLRKLSFTWVDCYATADPVSNGALVDDEQAQPCPAEVCNQSSALWDHTRYWENRDQFVTLLMASLAAADLREEVDLPPAGELASDRARLEWLAARRRWRVGLWTAVRWIGAGAVLAAVARAWPAWREFFHYWGARLWSWIEGLMGRDPQSLAEAAVHWGAIGYLALAVAPLLVVRSLWRAWNETEMCQLIERRHDNSHLGVLTAICFQALIALGVATGGVPGYLLFMATMVAVMVPVMVLEPRLPPELRARRSTTAGAAPESKSEQTLRHIKSLFSVLAAPFLFGFVFWICVCWVARKLPGGSLFGGNPEWVPAWLIGLLCALGVVLARLVRR